MGFVSYKGRTVYEGPLASVVLDYGWRNSMATYYPKVAVEYIVDNEICYLQLAIDDLVYPIESLTSEQDTCQLHDLERIKKQKREEAEARYIRMYKVVKVVRGRKFKIGTEGEVFWIGNTKFGASAGLRLLDGSKIFVAVRNLEVVMIDEAFEKIILDEK